MIETLPLFPILENKLIEILSQLSPGDWNRKTAAGKWTIKDVAAHLLDGSLRQISVLRDGYRVQPAETINSSSELISFLNKLNADWVEAFRRISPEIIIKLLRESAPEYIQLLTQLPPMDEAIYPVAWAGESSSTNWFHIAREYTEKWHHQQQIRKALNNDEIMTRELYHPVLATFMQALPYHFRAVSAPEGSSILIRITGVSGGEWILQRLENEWKLTSKTKEEYSAAFTIGQEYAWELFCKNIRATDIPGEIELSGNVILAGHVASMITVMA